MTDVIRYSTPETTSMPDLQSLSSEETPQLAAKSAHDQSECPADVVAVNSTSDASNDATDLEEEPEVDTELIQELTLDESLSAEQFPRTSSDDIASKNFSEDTAALCTDEERQTPSSSSLLSDTESKDDVLDLHRAAPSETGYLKPIARTSTRVTSTAPATLRRSMDIRAARDAKEDILPGYRLLNRFEMMHILMPYADIDGIFGIRPSESQSGTFSIDVTFQGSVRHFKIHRENGEFFIAKKRFPSARKLIHYYQRWPIHIRRGDIAEDILLLYPLSSLSELAPTFARIRSEGPGGRSASVSPSTDDQSDHSDSKSMGSSSLKKIASQGIAGW